MFINKISSSVSVSVGALFFCTLGAFVTGCSSIPDQYEYTSTNVPTATITVELDIPPKSLFGPKRRAHLHLLDYDKIMTGEACVEKGLIFKSYELNQDMVNLGAISATQKNPTKTMKIPANKTYLADATYVVSSDQYYYAEHTPVTFDPIPNTHYLFKYKGIKSSSGQRVGEFQFNIIEADKIFPVPETQLRESETFDCEKYLKPE